MLAYLHRAVLSAYGAEFVPNHFIITTFAQIEGPDAVISWEISLSSELLLFYLRKKLSTVMHAC